MFKGVTVYGDTPQPDEVLLELMSLPMPELKSWQLIPNPVSNFVWQVKPPGVWVNLLRYDELLVTSNPHVPLEVDYQHVYDMLGVHKAALLTRLDQDTGLIGVAVRKTNQPFTPLVPGFKASTLVDTSKLDASGVEQLSEEGHDWPKGLQKPSMIGMQAATSLLQPEHRKDWIRKCPEGIWLLNVYKSQLVIYEVFS